MSATIEQSEKRGSLLQEAGLPAYFVAEQAAARAEYEATPSPTRTDEAWRFSDLGAINTEGFVDAGPVTDEHLVMNRSQGLATVAGRMVFGNNTLISRETDSLPDGVLFLPLDQALRDHESLIREFFMAQPVELGSRKMAALHRASVRSGTFLYLPENAVVELPFEVFHWVEGDMASVFPHTLVVCGANSRVTLIDRFGSLDGKRALACGVNDLHLAPGARLHYSAIQDWSPISLAFHLNSTVVGRDAHATALSVNFGGRFVRGESLSRLAGSGARSEMFSINLLDGERMLDQRTLQDHTSPSASSDLLYLNALEDSSRSIFAGLIKVGEGAHRTDAYQKVRNLILSDTAEANSMPGLEILADDVRCTHGATSSDISDDELFYLQARGIPRELGRRLIVNGFFQTLAQRLDEQRLRAEVSSQVARKLGVPVDELA